MTEQGHDWTEDMSDMARILRSIARVMIAFHRAYPLDLYEWTGFCGTLEAMIGELDEQELPQ